MQDGGTNQATMAQIYKRNAIVLDAKTSQNENIEKKQPWALIAVMAELDDVKAIYEGTAIKKCSKVPK